MYFVETIWPSYKFSNMYLLLTKVLKRQGKNKLEHKLDFFIDKIKIRNSCKFLKKNEILNLPIFLFLTSQQNIMTFQFLGFFRSFQQALCPFGKVVFGFFDLWKWRRNHLVKKRTFLWDCSQAFKKCSIRFVFWLPAVLNLKSHTFHDFYILIVAST